MSITDRDRGNIVLRPKPPLPEYFGYLLARSDGLQAHAIQSMTGTTGRQRVPASALDHYRVALPTADVAMAFDKSTSDLVCAALGKVKPFTSRRRPNRVAGNGTARPQSGNIADSRRSDGRTRMASSGPSRPAKGPARIDYVKVQNYRALRSIELTPLTVLLGPNGSGKSTVFDVLCFETGLRAAWDRRGKAKELRTRGQDGPVVIELKYREEPTFQIITYHLAIDDGPKGPIVKEEWLQWRRGAKGKPFRFLDYAEGKREAVSGEMPDAEDKRIATPLRSPDLIAVNTLGQFEQHPRVATLREFITDWYVSYLSVEDTKKKQPEMGPQERLSRSGDNIANVLQYLKEHHADRLDAIFARLRQRIPRIERVNVEPMPDGNLLLEIKDAPFDQPVLARFASDGTIKMLA